MTRTADRTLLQTLGFDDPDRKNEEHDLACRFMVQPETMAKLADVLGVSPGRHYFEPPYTDIVATADHRGHVEVPVMRGQNYHIGFLDAALSLQFHLSGQVTRARQRTEEEIVAEVGPRRAPSVTRPPPVPPWVKDGFLEGQAQTWMTKDHRGVFLSDAEATRRQALSRDYWVRHTEFVAERNAPVLDYEARRRAASLVKVESVKSYEVVENPSEVAIEVKIGPTSIGSAIKQMKLYREYWRVNMAVPTRWVLATRFAITSADREALRNESITHIRLAAGFDAYLETLRRSGESGSAEF